MTFNAQTYLDCYNKLHSPQSSKQANKTLLSIQQSFQAWNIAEQLMSRQKNCIHGSQLLSKKLDLDLPSSLNPQLLAQFILSIKNICNIHWLCLAKLFIHTHQNLNDLKILGSLQTNIKLNILKEIPYALDQMKISMGIKSFQYKYQVYSQNKFIILETMQSLVAQKSSKSCQNQKLQDLVLQTLQNFSQHKVKLNSLQIAQFVLNHVQSDKSSTLLQQIFLEEQYPELEDQFQKFLEYHIKNDEKDWIKSYYLNFYAKKKIWVSFPVDKFKLVLNSITEMMLTKDEDKFRAILSDSYEFWLSLTNQYLKQLGKSSSCFEGQQKEKHLKQSLFHIFINLCEQSKLKRCPQKIKLHESKLDIIDLDQEEGIGESQNYAADQYDQINYNVNQIRDMSIDLIVKIQQTLKNDQAIHSKIFQTMYLLASNQQNLESLELSIFIVDGLTDFCDQFNTPFLSQLIKTILSQHSRLNQYICQRIVVMLGKIDKIIVSNISMLPLVFQFFSNTIMYQRLSSLASQSFTDLMDQYQVSKFESDKQFEQKSEKYLNFWFQNFYQKVRNQKVLENITKALVIFIYKFKGKQYYQKFLLMMHQKIENTTEQQSKDLYLQAIITSQNWINSKSQNQQIYLIIFAEFMSQFTQVLMERCLKVNKKQQFSKEVSKINWAIKAGCFYANISKWIDMIKKIISKALFQGDQSVVLPVALTPLISLLKSQLLRANDLSTLFSSLGQIIDPITRLFLKIHSSKTTLDYTFTKYILQMHNLTISKLVFNNELRENYLPNYDPNSIYNFIVCKIFANDTFWEYQVYKQSLIYINSLVASKFKVWQLCLQTLKISSRTLESLWIQTQNILLSIYKLEGISPFSISIEKIKSQLSPPNPLFSVFQEALDKSDRKALKAFIRCL